MKRNYYSTENEHNKSKFVKFSHHDEGEISTNICQLPDEILGSILDFILDPNDGLEFILTCKTIYRALYSNHHLFISCRFVREVNLAMAMVKHLKSPPKFSKDETWRTSLYDIQLENCLILIEKFAKQRNIQLLIKQTCKAKFENFKIYLKRIEKEHGKNIAELFEKNLFEKYRLQMISMFEDDWDGTYNFKATVAIGEVTIALCLVSDDGDYKSYWDIHVDNVELAEKPKDGIVRVNTNVLESLIRNLDLSLIDTIKQDVRNNLFCEVILSLFPWDEEYSTYSVQFN